MRCIPPFNNWDEFRKHIDGYLPGFSYWRGQRDPSWSIASPFERKILTALTGTTTAVFPYEGKGFAEFAHTLRRIDRDGYVSAFRRACSGLRGKNPRELSTDEWWALGRHYGLVTPLLDWTRSPYMAAFFALADAKSTYGHLGDDWHLSDQWSGSVAVYKYDPQDDLSDEGLRIVNVQIDELGRLQAQRGLFTYLDSDRYFELQGFLNENGIGEWLNQIIISGPAIKDGLRDLAAHGIDHRLLFPDLEGAARHVNFGGPWLDW